MLLIFCLLKKEKICPAYVSKCNSNCEKQVILIMNSNREKRYYLTVKTLNSTLLWGITLKNNSNFYYLNCIHSFRTKIKSQPHKRVCKIKTFCNLIMLSEDTKLLEFNQYQKFD